MWFLDSIIGVFYLQESIPVDEAAQSSNLAPRIGIYGNNQFYIFIENSFFCKTDDFSHAVFLMFSSFYQDTRSCVSGQERRASTSVLFTRPVK